MRINGNARKELLKIFILKRGVVIAGIILFVFRKEGVVAVRILFLSEK